MVQTKTACIKPGKSVSCCDNSNKTVACATSSSKVAQHGNAANYSKVTMIIVRQLLFLK